MNLGINIPIRNNLLYNGPIVNIENIFVSFSTVAADVAAVDGGVDGNGHNCRCYCSSYSVFIVYV